LAALPEDSWLEVLARRLGRLSRGNEPDTLSVAPMIIRDWQKGSWANKKMKK
jgi:ribosome biogenesis GTPase A